MALSKAQIVEELERVSASAEFRNKPVMKRLLTYLVNEHIEGRADQIKGFSIAVDVFGQGKSFDSDRSAVVRNSAVRLRGLLDAYYLGAGSADPVRIDIPKGGYAPKISTNTNGAEAEPRTVGEDGCISVAVLPFSYQSSSGTYDYIATGFSQELSDALTRFDNLRVIGVGQLMGHDSEPSRMADEIQNKRIDFLISGSVKVHKQQGRLTMRLIDAADNHQVWKKNYAIDLSLDNLFDAQEEIAGRIASQVGGEYGRINQARFQILLQSQPRTLSEHEVLLKYYHVTTVLTEEAIFDYQVGRDFPVARTGNDQVCVAAEAGNRRQAVIESPLAPSAFEIYAHHPALRIDGVKAVVDQQRPQAVGGAVGRRAGIERPVDREADPVLDRGKFRGRFGVIGVVGARCQQHQQRGEQAPASESQLDASRSSIFCCRNCGLAGPGSPCCALR